MKLDSLGLNHSLFFSATCQTVRPRSSALSLWPLQDRAAPLLEHQSQVTCMPTSELLVIRLRLEEDASDPGDSRHGLDIARSWSNRGRPRQVVLALNSRGLFHLRLTGKKLWDRRHELPVRHPAGA